ncbi:glycosyltransferase [uncultured Nitratireductor sp.]|uniref:glycosyltransferase family 2 protein n=1 Tax=uncultured Nitratireductor sp. TaxID=520953 RepID=UPI00261DE109|nr:glycosyltransferase [uncultured Nitratireductor sp.]
MTRKLVSTIIPTYNQENFIEEAVESAIAQIGPFDHEIIISSDGSTDGTFGIVQRLRRRYPALIVDVSREMNVGISNNFKRLFSAARGEYIAVLEGDDCWTDSEKLAKQIAFLDDNSDCSMVFSKIIVKDLSSGKEMTLKRQSSIEIDKLTGSDFLADPTLNLIANFSCCMFRTRLMKSLPDVLFAHRFNEIAVAFYLDNFGTLGFIKEPMSVYRQHPAGVWTGSDKLDQLRGGLEARRAAKIVARPEHKDAIEAIIRDKYLPQLSQLALVDKG